MGKENELWEQREYFCPQMMNEYLLVCELYANYANYSNYATYVNYGNLYNQNYY